METNTGNADSATEVALTDKNGVTQDGYITFTEDITGTSQLGYDAAFTYNANAHRLNAANFDGNGSLLTNLTAANLTGALPAIDGSALTSVNAGTVALTATNTTNAAHYLCIVDSATGNENVRTDTDLQYNPNTNTLTSTNFSGTLAGNATGLSGTPAITVGNITSYNILPAAHNTYDLGSTATRFANIYSADLQLSNKDATPNSVDGTWGDWTLQEGEEDIFMINNRSGKKYKINLTEV